MSIEIEEVAQDIIDQYPEETQTVFQQAAVEDMLRLFQKQQPQYTSFKFLGIGGNGLVLKVSDDTAIKIVMIQGQQSIKLQEQLEQEYTFLDQFSPCGYILKVNKKYFLTKVIKKEKQKCYFVLESELCDGNLDTLLRSLRKENKQLSEQQIANFVMQALDALNFIHQKNICHRDIKPSNFLLKHQNGEITLKLCDFGSAKAGKTALKTVTSKLTSMKGTVNYQAPEVSEFQYFQEIENIHFNFENIKTEELADLYRQINEDPFINHKTIIRDSLVYDIARNFLKRDPKQRKTAKEQLLNFIEKSKYKINADMEFFSIIKQDNLQTQLKKMNVNLPSYVIDEIVKMKCYEEFEYLGEGTYGKILGAVNRANNNTKIALKIQRITDQLNGVISSEVEIMMKLDCPYILKLFSHKIVKNEYDEQFSIIEMERCECKTLKEFLKLKFNNNNRFINKIFREQKI